MPFSNEGPNVVFTIQGLIEELEAAGVDFEIIAVDNMSHPYLQCKAGDREYPVRSRAYFYNEQKGRKISTWFFRTGRVKYYVYDDKQGHWNAKNFGISKSTGDYLFFVDAHCLMKRDSLAKMHQWLKDNWQEKKVGGLHAYINYMLDSRSLEYRVERKTFGYKFCTHQIDPVTKAAYPSKPYPVCVMSTCGMMCPRPVIDDLGPWSPELGIYGGGESYINWKQSTCGWTHWIHPEAWCWHWAEKRGYAWNWSDFTRNSMIAAYVVGGDDYLQEQVDARINKASPEHLYGLADDVREKCKADRDFVASRQIETFDEYIARWQANPGVWR